MGGFFSSNAPVDAPDDRPLYDSSKPLTTQEIKKRNEQDMEREFDALYKRSKLLLASMASNPCEHLAERIKQCLDNNTHNMINCFGEMESYQQCVADKRSELIERKLNIPVPLPSNPNDESPKKFCEHYKNP